MRLNVPLTVALALLLTLPGLARAQGTPAGTVISNTASADVISDPGRPSFQVVSNTVTSAVAAVCTVSVTPDGTVPAPGQQSTISSGDSAVFPYRLTNTGNDPFSFELGAAQDPASNLALAAGDLQIYRDTNSSGTLDAGDVPVTALTLSQDAGADLLLVAKTSAAAKGVAFLSLTAACAGGGASDNGNIARLTVNGVSKLRLEKRFSVATAVPGDTLGVTVTASNDGNEGAQDLSIDDLLNTPELAGLAYLPGSADVDAGTVRAATDGLHWSLPALAAGGQSSLSFKMNVLNQTPGGSRTNVATLLAPGGQRLQASAALTIGAAPRLALGPISAPEALPGGEGSPDDQQTVNGALVGQPTCFVQTVKNTGNLDDRVTLSTQLSGGDAVLTLLDTSGQPLKQPLTLAVGASLNFQVCATPASAADVGFTVTARSSVSAPDNLTRDRLTGLDSRSVALVKTVDPTGSVRDGTILSYTLTATNPYSAALTNVTLSDTLNPALVFVSADQGGSLKGNTVQWTLATLAPGQSVSVHVKASVRVGTPDGATITNTFTFSSTQTQAPQTSAAVSTPVWTSALEVRKTVTPDTATIGDLLTYTLWVHNASPASPLTGVSVTDPLPDGLQYLPGSSQLDGQPLADPAISGQTLVWTLPALQADQARTVRFQVRVLPGARADMLNTVTARALAGQQAQQQTAIASNMASVAVKIKLGLFAPLGEVIGRVFVDRNRDGRYQPGLDTPVERARVLLSNGAAVLTDAQGRYHFANLSFGSVTLRLDPNSVPYPALSVPQDGGLNGSRTVQLNGLTSVDFPVSALMGTVTQWRIAQIEGGGVRVRKTVTVDQSGLCTARLTVQAALPVSGFVLSDPLPTGATLTSGQSVWTLILLPAGETVFTSSFRLAAPLTDPVTDPTMSWRFQ